ncbi:IPExxxVDY family protein [Flavobacterium restrictum]|uniref:IPExxxVDY family protein n=1 Tax=Flavobacterium restrictum TaxID=2594428 RepID=A0A553DVH6_9FLAO|nr:IPExxxVDY family protein [Flavobacterium restrictum]TRX36670.1 IPExxxVDY family protein [Flavobacterium restrictum]
MAIHKLSLDEFEEIDYLLIAIHTSLEDYRLAYFINQRLGINLNKNQTAIQINIKEGEGYFSRFFYNDLKKETTWHLIQNKNEVIQNQKGGNQNLFSNILMEVATKVYLLPEFKKTDYFLKIENSHDTIKMSKIQSLLNTIESISTVYAVDKDKIKSKNNLIF